MNRVMRLNNNPAARGFIVRVLEETSRDDGLGIINFRTIASRSCGTKKAAHRAYDELKAQFCAR